MRFTVRSLGGKLIISAALTLLLCMLLFSTASWLLLNFFYEHEARSDATTHLGTIRIAYHAQIASLLQDLNKEEAADRDLAAAVSQPPTPSSQSHLEEFLNSLVKQYPFLSSPAIISKDGMVLAGAQYPRSLIKQGLQGQTVSSLEIAPAASKSASSGSSSWNIDLAVPIKDRAGVQVVGVLVASQPIDKDFAADLVRNTGLNVILCESGHMLGTTMPNISESTLCS